MEPAQNLISWNVGEGEKPQMANKCVPRLLRNSGKKRDGVSGHAYTNWVFMRSPLRPLMDTINGKKSRRKAEMRLRVHRACSWKETQQNESDEVPKK